MTEWTEAEPHQPGSCPDDRALACPECIEHRQAASRVPLSGAMVLDRVREFISQYVIFPDEHCAPAVALWAAHTHAVKSFYVTPRLILDSAEPESAKTRVLELLALLCHNPKMILNTTVAALYRRLQQRMLTVLLDEADAIWSPRQNGPQAEDLRAFVNAGYKRGATVDRCVGEGKKMAVVEFPVFAPVALAGIAGNMPPTITTRAVTIHMRRRAPGEHVDEFIEEDVVELATPIQVVLRKWVTSLDGLKSSRPVMPNGVADRKAEIWKALLAIADAAGGDWPAIARRACEHFVLGPGKTAPVSLGVRLLGDLRRIFGDRDRMATAEILEKLHGMEEAPWSDLRGKPLDARALSNLLGRYDVRPATVDLGDGTGRKAKGYTTYGFENREAVSVGLLDAWRRYDLPASSGKEGNGGGEGNGAGQ